MVDMRNRLAKLLCKILHPNKLCKGCKGDICKNCFKLADSLICNNVTFKPNTVEDLIDSIFSRNETIALWYDIEEESGGHLLWRGTAYQLPVAYRKLKFVSIFGAISDSMYHSDVINIYIKFYIHQI